MWLYPAALAGRASPALPDVVQRTKGRHLPCQTSGSGDSAPDLSCLLELLVKAEGSQWCCQQQDLAHKGFLLSPWPLSLEPECAQTGKPESCTEMKRDG